MTATTVRPPLWDVTAASFTQVIAHDRAVADLDPLRMDWYFRFMLPLVNSIPMWAVVIRVWLLARAAARYAPTDARIKAMTPLQAMAATRDLSMVAASLRRCGKEPGFVPALEAALLSLSVETHAVPGDTVWTYGGSQNPVDPRRTRRFTLYRRERLFIRDLQTGMNLLPRAVDLMLEACAMSIYDPDYAGTLEAALECLEPMVTAIHASRQNISPTFFTYKLRPFFDPKLIGGKLYNAAGAAQMPLIWIDLLLWAINTGKPPWRYWTYFLDNLGYQPEYLREQVERLYDVESLLGRARREVAENGLNDVALRSLVALHAIFRVMLRFRAPHLLVAKKNMELRGEGSVGSGGYQSSLLVFLMEVIRDGRDEVRDMLPKGAVRG